MGICKLVEKFSDKMRGCGDILSSSFSMDFREEKIIGVGVSGGPDSMALLRLLSKWSMENKGPEILAVTVDHCLRKESALEAKMVEEYAQNLTNVSHVTVKWEEEKPDTGIMEEARAARYKLIANILKKQGGRILLLAHHMNDQAETVLFRLSKGSGIKGLCGIREVQKMADTDMILVRPLLSTSKDELIEYCKEEKINFVNDPSNENEKYARARLRKSFEILEKEGLSAERMAKLAKRIARADEALDYYSNILFMKAIEINDGVLFVLEDLMNVPEEIRNRTVLQAIKKIGGNISKYGVRIHRFENVIEDIFKDNKNITNKNKNITRTVGGCLLKKYVKRNEFLILRENKS